MEQHTVELPRIVFIGRGGLEKLPEICMELGLRGKPLVLSGEKTREIAGRKAAELFSAFSPAAETAKEASYAETGRIKKSAGIFDFIIAAGGGRVIDAAKLLAFTEKKPFISIPTAPSHDGIASDRVSIKDSGQFRYSIQAKPPLAVVADIDILENAPYRMVASGCADVIANYTAVYDWKLGREKGEYYSEYAAALSLLSAEIVIKSAEIIKNREERGLRNLMEALVSSGIAMSLAGSSRPSSGSEHLFSHALDMLGSYPANQPTLQTGLSALGNRSNFKQQSAEWGGMHGEQCGLGTILMAYLQNREWKMVRDKLSLIGAPVTAKELGLTEEQVVKALLEAKNVRKRHTILDEKPLDEKKAAELCRETGVV